jgi:hypothetical protein
MVRLFIGGVQVDDSLTLTAALGVESPDVVIYDSGRFLIDVFVEDLTAEEWYVVLSIHGPIEGDSV